MNSDMKHDLIIAIVNQGYSGELITAARESGARGGTILNARGMTHEGPVKLFGLSLQEEKEIITILTAREQKIAIMQRVSQDFGISTQAEGIVFSLPVDRVNSFFSTLAEEDPRKGGIGADAANAVAMESAAG